MKSRAAFLVGLILGLIPHPPIVLSLPRHPLPVIRQTGYPLHHEAIERMKQLTVLIANEGFTGGSRGTGILIDSTHVLTCAHMIGSPTSEMWLYLYPGMAVLRGTVEKSNRGLDLAIIRLNRPVKMDVYPVFQEKHGDGQPITIIGNMLGSMKWVVSYGTIIDAEGHYLLTDGLIHGGNSGGPWINEAGEVVALTDWGLTRREIDQNVSGGVSAQTINKFIKDWQHPRGADILLQLLGQ